MNTAYSLSDIKNFGFQLFNGICDETHTTNLPTALKDGTTSFLVVSTPTTLTDNGAYGKCTLMVEVFVKSKPRGIEDLQKMRTLQNAVLDKINSFTRTATNPYHIQYDTNTMFSEFDEKMGFHVTINFFDITIIKI